MADRDMRAGREPSRVAADRGEHSHGDREDTVYEGGQERVRTEIMAAFGYFHTESSHHASEYLPYFRTTPELARSFIPERWDYYDVCAAHDEAGQAERLLSTLKAELTPSVEYGALIVHAIETRKPRVVYGNVGNHGLIPNLPAGCCVEVPCLVDANGVQPTAVGPLPAQCAAVNRTNVNVQELAVEAVLTEDPNHVCHAVMLDPLTAAVLTLEQIRGLVDDLVAAQGRWLPAFLARAASRPDLADVAGEGGSAVPAPTG